MYFKSLYHIPFFRKTLLPDGQYKANVRLVNNELFRMRILQHI